MYPRVFPALPLRLQPSRLCSSVPALNNSTQAGSPRASRTGTISFSRMSPADVVVGVEVGVALGDIAVTLAGMVVKVDEGVAVGSSGAIGAFGARRVGIWRTCQVPCPSGSRAQAAPAPAGVYARRSASVPSGAMSRTVPAAISTRKSGVSCTK